MNKDFEHYLHLKRWSNEETDRKWLKSLEEPLPNHYGTSFFEFQRMWVESAIYQIDEYEKQYPEWKESGDKERESFWKKSEYKAKKLLK